MQQEPMRNYLYDEGILLTGYSILRSADSAKPDQPVLLKDAVLLKIAEEIGKITGEVELKFISTIELSAALLAKSITPEHIYMNNHLDFNLTLDQVQSDSLHKKDFCATAAQRPTGELMSMVIVDKYLPIIYNLINLLNIITACIIYLQQEKFTNFIVTV